MMFSEWVLENIFKMILFPLWVGYLFAWQVRISVLVDQAMATDEKTRLTLLFPKIAGYVINIAGLFGFLVISGKALGDIRFSLSMIVGVLAYWVVSRPISRLIPKGPN